MVRVVFIGCGRIAASHWNGLKQIGEAQVVGVCDQNAESAQRMAETCGCPAYTDAETMLTELKPDMAIICVPTFVHEECVVLCAKHRVNVLCEKPLGRTPVSVRRMLDAVKESGILFMTAQVVRFWPGYVEIKDIVDRGELGRIYMIRCRRVTSRGDAVAKWLNMPKKGGGALHDMLVHDVDYLRYLCGPFERGYANAVKDETGSYNNVMANITFKNGIHAMAEASFTMQTGYPFSFSISLIGEKATLEYDFHSGIRIGETDKNESHMRIWREGTGLEELTVEDGDGFEREQRYFISCLEAGKQPELIPAEQTYEVMLMVDALHESAHTGKVIELDGYTPFDFKHPDN